MALTQLVKTLWYKQCYVYKNMMDVVDTDSTVLNELR